MDKRDKIYLNNLKFYAYHGLFQEEKTLGQRFRVDLILFSDLSRAEKSGRMEDSVHYGEAYETVKRVMEGPSVELLEELSGKVAQAILKDFKLVDEVMVRLVKPDPPIPGHYDSVAIEIFRTRKA